MAGFKNQTKDALGDAIRARAEFMAPEDIAEELNTPIEEVESHLPKNGKWVLVDIPTRRTWRAKSQRKCYFLKCLYGLTECYWTRA